MADNTEVQQPTNEIPAELKQQMDISMNLNNPSFFENQQQQDQSQGQQGDNQQQSLGDQNQQQQQPDKVVDIFAPFKEKFGYETPEAAITEIEQLRALKAAPPTPAELKFENEQSKKVFEALQAGKVQEVYEFLHQQSRLDALSTAEITKDNADSVIKLGLQLEYPTLTQAEIDYKVSKQFATPKIPVQALDETDEDFEVRKSDWEAIVRDIEMSKIIEAKLAKPKLDAAKSKLVLPEVAQNTSNANQEQQLLEQQAELDRQTKEAYKAVKPEALKAKIGFNDEANKIAFDYEFEPDTESFAVALEAVANGDKFWELFKNQDGSPDRLKFLKTIYYGLNFEKALMEGMKQAKNATIKSQLPDNNTGGLNRQTQSQTQHEPTELDKHLQMALGQYMPR